MKTIVSLLLIFIAFDCSAGIAEKNHAYQQVKQMILDRPNMGRFFTKDNRWIFITEESMPHKYAIEFFSKKINGEFIFWSTKELTHSPWVRAVHVIHRKGKPGEIRLRKSFNMNGNKRELTTDELWAGFIFETKNIENAKYFLKYKNDAINRKLNRKEYIKLNQELEYFALEKKKRVYIKNWLPWAKENQIITNFAHTMDIPTTFNEWIKKRKSNKKQAYVYWENYYDSVLSPYIKKKYRL
jgi:hypothetical protein